MPIVTVEESFGTERKGLRENAETEERQTHTSSLYHTCVLPRRPFSFPTLCRLLILLKDVWYGSYLVLVAHSDCGGCARSMFDCPCCRPYTIAESQRAPTSGGTQSGPRKASSSATTQGQGRILEDFVAVSEVSFIERE